MDSCFNLERAYKRMKLRNYAKLYWCIDLHDTIIESKYKKSREGREFFPDAKEVLGQLSRRDDMCIILCSSSEPDYVKDILDWFSGHGIKIDHVNKNPDMPEGYLCDFSSKFAFDILLDDKAGFEGKIDWTTIKNKLKELNLWTEK